MQNSGKNSKDYTVVNQGLFYFYPCAVGDPLCHSPVTPYSILYTVLHLDDLVRLTLRIVAGSSPWPRYL